MNTLTTKRPRLTPLPIHYSTVEHRIKMKKQELGINTSKNLSFDDRLKAIQLDMKIYC